jgi:hypothetical protein
MKKQPTFNVFIVLWSRTEHGKQEIRGAHKTLRQAKSAIKQLEVYEAGWFVAREYEYAPNHVTMYRALKDMVKVIRNFECGDYSPIMDELFDAEEAIRLAERNKS